MEWVRNIAAFSIALAMAGLLLYGVMRFPNSPIERCATGYCGKWGTPSTEQEYLAHRTWLGVVVVVWPVGMIALFALWAPYFFPRKP
jgi:hypothetical protein